jgi:prepilin-type N-terminal cleavage/methylation domain-containing protein
MNSRNGKKDDGFTLLEALVSLLILSLSVAVLFGVFSDSATRLGKMQQRSQGLAHARSLLDSLQANTDVAASSSGDFGDGYSWSIRSAPYASAGDQRSWSYSLRKVDISVAWGTHPTERVDLSTLQLGAKDSTP